LLLAAVSEFWQRLAPTLGEPQGTARGARDAAGAVSLARYSALLESKEEVGMDPTVRIEFDGNTGFWFELFGQDEVGPGTSVELEGGVRLTYTDAYIAKGIDAANWIEIALMIPPAAVSAAAIARTIAERLVRRGPEPDKVRRVEIQRRTVEFEEGEIRRVIEELIRELPADDA